ncbi:MULTISPECIES: hypothetical protein [unclassified Bradyrhizobium]|uniref:hypothetical protein n=1 Tax=unclassified Bradyrhizobium TaxID=2631580 RepID=UPI002915E48A|nr:MULTISPECIES: hypothetical protein [unclassified Bradyrhizobium]
MKFITPSRYADPEVAARELVRISAGIDPVQDGRIFIEKINWPMLADLKAAPAEYKAGLDLAVARGWLWLHESGTYVRLTEAGKTLLA